MVLGFVWVCQRRSGSNWGPKDVTGLPARWVQTLSSVHRCGFIEDAASLPPWRVGSFRDVLRLFSWSKNIRCHPIGPAGRNSFFWTSKKIASLSSRGLHGPICPAPEHLSPEAGARSRAQTVGDSRLCACSSFTCWESQCHRCTGL